MSPNCATASCLPSWSIEVILRQDDVSPASIIIHALTIRFSPSKNRFPHKKWHLLVPQNGLQLQVSQVQPDSTSSSEKNKQDRRLNRSV